jgi:hypothetical protein
MSRTAIFGLVCTAFLVFLGYSAVPQERERKGADAESGQLTFNNACRTCHTTKEGDNRLGPNLHNIMGRKAGSLPNYGYSSAMKGADFVWDKEKLDRFIERYLGRTAHRGRGPRQDNCILGVPQYQLRGIRHRTHTESIFLSTLGLIELHGDDLRHDPLAGRKATLASMLAKAAPGIRLNEHVEAA